MFLAIQCETCEEYKACGSSNPQTCRNRCQAHVQLPIKCVEGCYCQNDTVKHNGKCIKTDECPCYDNDVEYLPGAIVMKNETGKCIQKW